MAPNCMRKRSASTLLVLNPDGHLLLFRFAHTDGPLAGKTHWATPGGGLESNETFVQAAVRELREETGIAVGMVGAAVACREFVLTLADGEQVLADERFFVVHTVNHSISGAHWTESERKVMTEHRWWTASELQLTNEVVWPRNLHEMLRAAGLW